MQMANILESNIVSYVCACGHLNPITKLFFCRHCLKPRCGFCVCHEVSITFSIGKLSNKFLFVILQHHCEIVFLFLGRFSFLLQLLGEYSVGRSEIEEVSLVCFSSTYISECRNIEMNLFFHLFCFYSNSNKCFECPSCQHTLSSRATTVHVPRDSDAKVDGKGDTKGDAKEESKGDGKTETASPASPAPGAEKSAAAKMPTRKMYYLSCLACRWTSRDVGLPDQTMGTNLIFSLHFLHRFFRDFSSKMFHCV